MEPILTPIEVEALVEFYKGGIGIQGAQLAIDYDLVGGDQLLRRVAPVIDMVRPNLSHLLGKFLTFKLGVPTKCEAMPNDIIPYAALAAGFPRPACVGILSLQDGGQLLLDVSPELYFMAVERTMGGQGFDTPSSRGPTTIEQRMGLHLMRRIVEALNAAWGNIFGSQFSVEKVEFWAEKIDIIEPEDFVLRQEIHVMVGEVSTNIAVIMPATTLEPIRKSLDRTVGAEGSMDKRHALSMVNRLKRAQVDITVELGKASLNLGSIRNMKSGDVIRLDTSTGDRLPVKISGKTKFTGLPVVTRGNMAVKLTEKKNS